MIEWIFIIGFALAIYAIDKIEAPERSLVGIGIILLTIIVALILYLVGFR